MVRTSSPHSVIDLSLKRNRVSEKPVCAASATHSLSPGSIIKIQENIKEVVSSLSSFLLLDATVDSLDLRIPLEIGGKTIHLNLYSSISFQRESDCNEVDFTLIPSKGYYPKYHRNIKVPSAVSFPVSFEGEIYRWGSNVSFFLEFPSSHSKDTYFCSFDKEFKESVVKVLELSKKSIRGSGVDNRVDHPLLTLPPDLAIDHRVTKYSEIGYKPDVTNMRF